MTTKSRYGRSRASVSRRLPMSRSVDLWIFLLFLAVLTISGGSARADQPSVMLIRSTAVLVLGFALARFGTEEWQSIRSPARILLALLALIFLQLVPIPPAVWGALPGRAQYLATYANLQIPAPWLTISLFPTRTWNSFVSLVVPLAAICGWAVLPPRHRKLIVPILIGIGLFSALLGFMQMLSGGARSLYLYPISNFGSNCGIFANRNHQAVFQATLLLMVPMARRDLDSDRIPPFALNILAMAIIALLILSIFTTGSRAGFVVGIAGAIWAAWNMHTIVDEFATPRRRRAREKFSISHRTQKLLIPGFVFVLVMLALMTPNNVVIERLMNGGGDAPIEDMRVTILENSMNMLPDNILVGGGAGTFADVYKGYEKLDGISYRYVNHAHDEVLEIIYEFGVLGIVLMIVTLASLARWFIIARRTGPDAKCRAEAYGLALAMIIFGSLFDYPARTPFIATYVTLLGTALFQQSRHFQKI